jgi:arylsulfatase A
MNGKMKPILPPLTLFGLATILAASPADRPNILLLFADDLGFEALGCYGGLDFETPNLDKLAAGGMRFSRVYTSPVCTPSRMSLYTGTYVTRHGYDYVLPVHQGTKKAVDFRNRHKTFAQLLRKSGYLTSVTGKWQLATLEFHPDHIRDAGFDSWCVWQIWMEGKKTTRYWNPCLNHDGKVREDIAKRFGPDVLHEYVKGQMKAAKEAGKPFYIHHNMMLPHIPVVNAPGSEGKTLKAMVSYMDRLCGELVDEVDNLGIAENTWVIFMGDNGTDLGTPRRTKNGLVTGGKRFLGEGGMHIPMIVRKPDTIEPGTVAEDLVDIADWFPTICDLTGTPIPENTPLDGISLAKRLTCGKPHTREYVTAGIGGNACVSDGIFFVTNKTPEETDNPATAKLLDILKSLPKNQK